MSSQMTVQQEAGRRLPTTPGRQSLRKAPIVGRLAMRIWCSHQPPPDLQQLFLLDERCCLAKRRTTDVQPSPELLLTPRNQDPGRNRFRRRSPYRRARGLPWTLAFSLQCAAPGQQFSAEPLDRDV